jgi:DNA-binding transcriptional MerR regulator
MLQQAQDEILGTAETARVLEVSEQGVRFLEKSGRLTAVRMTNGRRLFMRSEIERVKREREEAKRR